MGTPGSDIANLLEGLGPRRGLALMFRRMRKLTWGVATFKILETVSMLVTHTSAWSSFAASLKAWVISNVPFLRGVAATVL